MAEPEKLPAMWGDFVGTCRTQGKNNSMSFLKGGSAGLGASATSHRPGIDVCVARCGRAAPEVPEKRGLSLGLGLCCPPAVSALPCDGRGALQLPADGPGGPAIFFPRSVLVCAPFPREHRERPWTAVVCGAVLRGWRPGQKEWNQATIAADTAPVFSLHFFPRQDDPSVHPSCTKPSRTPEAEDGSQEVAFYDSGMNDLVAVRARDPSLLMKRCGAASAMATSPVMTLGGHAAKQRLFLFPFRPFLPSLSVSP